jgi:hypothetical protein
MKAESLTCCFAIEGYPLWNAARAISYSTDPYSDIVTEQNDIASYGTSSASRGVEPQRFVFPIYAALLMLPIARLTFHTASTVLLALFTGLLCLWIGWYRGVWDRRTTLYTALALCSYPVFYGLVSLQPTILFIAMAIASLALFRSGSWAAAAALTVLSLAKPQVALAIALPMVVVSLSTYRLRWRFIAYLIGFGTAVAAITLALWPTWVREWIMAARAYASCAPAPMAVSLFGSFGRVGYLLIAAGYLLSLWLFRRSSLAFQISLSIVLLYLLAPYRTYNAVILVIPLIWLLDNAAAVKDSGAAAQIALAAVRIAVIAVWILTAVGALLLRLGWQPDIGVLLPVLALRWLFFALLGAMLLQSAAEFRARPAAGSAVSNGIPESGYPLELPSQ